MPDAGNIDGSGSSMSAQSLAAAGVTSGATVSAGVPLQAGKAVSAVVLPNVGTTLVSGTPVMHLFAMALG